MKRVRGMWKDFSQYENDDVVSIFLNSMAAAMGGNVRVGLEDSLWLGKGELAKSNADQVKNQTGFSIGGVSPVAHLEKIKILIDSSLSRYENVYAAAGHPNSIFKITYKQMIKLTEGKEEDIV